MIKIKIRPNNVISLNISPLEILIRKCRFKYRIWANTTATVPQNKWCMMFCIKFVTVWKSMTQYLKWQILSNISKKCSPSYQKYKNKKYLLILGLKTPWVQKPFSTLYWYVSGHRAKKVYDDVARPISWMWTESEPNPSIIAELFTHNLSRLLQQMDKNHSFTVH